MSSSNAIHVTADDEEMMPGSIEPEPTYSPRNASNDREARLAALERRLGVQTTPTTARHSSTATSDAHTTPASAEITPEFVPFDADHEKRQAFRRLVDPGIMRPNAKEVAIASLRVNPT